MKSQPETEDGPSAPAGGGGCLRAHVTALRRNPFLRRLALLSGSVAIGQAFLFAITPLLTRLYGPEMFGAFGVLYALVMLIGNAGLLKLEPRLGICPPEEIPVALATHLVCAVAVVASVVAGMLVLTEIAPADRPVPSWGAVMLPVLLLLQIASLPVSYLHIRNGDFPKFALQRVARLVGQGAGQLGFGWAGLQSWGLAFGLAIGQLAELAVGRRALAGAFAALRVRHFLAVTGYVRCHWKYPVYSLPSAVLSEASHGLPVLVTASLYGPHEAGLLAVAQRILLVPTRLLGHSASHVIMGERPGNAGPGFYRTVRNNVLVFAMLGLIGIVLVHVIGDRWWTMLLGKQWQGLGEVFRILIPYYATFLVSESLLSLHIILDAQWSLFLRSLLLAGFTLGAAAAAHLFGLDFATFAGAYAFANAAVCAGVVVLLLRRARAFHTGRPADSSAGRGA